MKEINDVIDNITLNQRIQLNLRKNFQEAMHDSNFRTIVTKLNLEEEILMKYTSQLEDCAQEYEHCLHCKNLLACKNKITGYVYLPEVIEGNLEFNYVACKYQQKKLKEQKYLGNILLFDMPQDIKNARMKHIITDDENRFEAIKAVHDFIKQYRKEKTGKGIYLHGSFGCGKTYLLSAMLQEFAKEDVKSAIIFWPEFLRNLKSSFGTTYQEKFETVKKVPLLLIDDIGSEVVTPWGRDEILCSILQYRMQEHLPTFFTSNLTLAELEEHLSMTSGSVDLVKSRRIIERIRQLAQPIAMISKNLR